MKTAAQLKAELEPFVTGKRNRCMSEIDALLVDIYGYLSAQPLVGRVLRSDPTTKSQMNLDLPQPPHNSYRPVMSGTHVKNADTGEVWEAPCYSHADEFPG